MIDMRVRPHVQGLLRPIGRVLVRFGVTPAAMTLVGLAITLAGAVLVGMGSLRLGALVALVGSALDGLDGTVARESGTESARGALLDAGVDRVGEVAVFAGLAVAVAGQARLVLAIILALGGAMLVPYLRAKAEAAGLDGRGGIMGRAERVILFTLGLVTGWVEPMLWAMVGLTWITVGQRFADTYRDLKT